MPADLGEQDRGTSQMAARATCGGTAPSARSRRDPEAGIVSGGKKNCGQNNGDEKRKPYEGKMVEQKLNPEGFRITCTMTIINCTKKLSTQFVVIFIFRRHVATAIEFNRHTTCCMKIRGSVVSLTPSLLETLLGDKFT